VAGWVIGGLDQHKRKVYAGSILRTSNEKLKRALFSKKLDLKKSFDELASEIAKTPR